MSKSFTSLVKGAGLGLALAATAFAPWQSATAGDLLMNENFEYSPGNLYNQGGWVKYGTNPEGPIQVEAGNLVYTGYINEGIGNRVALTRESLGEDLWKAFDNNTMVDSGTVYASFLINVSDVNNSNTWFFNMFAQTRAGMVDGKSSTEVAKVWLEAGSDAQHFKLGISRNGNLAKAVVGDTEYEVGQTYLVVAAYEFVDGNTNDKCYLWVNPDTNLETAPAPYVSNNQELEPTSSEASTNYGGLMGVLLRQSGTGSSNAPDLHIDAIRVGTAWADLFPAQEPGPVVTTPTLTLSAPFARLGQMYNETVMTTSTFVGGKNLTGPVTVTCPEGVTCNMESVAPELAMAEEPVELIFTVTAPSTGDGEFEKVVTLSSEGAEDVKFTITGEIVPTVAVPNSTKFVQEFEGGAYEGVVYRYTGKAVVTAIDKNVTEYYTEYYIYAQDMFGGLMLNTSYVGVEDPGVKVGDEITGMPFIIEGFLGAPQMMVFPFDAEGNFARVTAEGKSKTPADVKIADVTATTAMEYLYRLLKLDSVRFSGAEGQFVANTYYDITDGENTAKLKVSADSGLAGTDIPTGTFSVTGVSVNPKGLSLLVTDKEAFVAGAPVVDIKGEKTFDFATNAAPVNVKTEIAKYTVVAENLPVAVPVTITGANANMFEAVPSEVPAGSGTTVVTVYYYPDAPGMHKGGILFDFDAINPEFNYSQQFGTCKAYDPAHMPEISIEPAVIELECKAGETITGTATLNAVTTFDYITASRSGSGDNGGITIDNTYLLPGSKDVTLTVTFAPKAEGEYTETWTYTSTMCATPATLTVKAKCISSLPEEPTQGDTEFKADFTNPLSWYTQDFAEVENNKPLSLEGWTNVAEEGTRAWWGYTGDNGDEFTAAKVTAYDSTVKPGEGKPCAMMLVSPALDYKNAPVKKLKFRLMGMFLNENSGDELTVNMGELTEGPEGPELDFYELTGFNIPTTADEAGNWIEYDVDMSVVPDMPDAFVIAFEFTGTRGADNTTTYYITDFEWGAKAESLEAIEAAGVQPDADGWYTVYNLQGITVLRTREVSELGNLPAGLYISGGRKFVVK